MRVLHVTNMGLEMKYSVDEDRIKYYDKFAEEGKDLIEKNGDTPKRSVIEQFCFEWDERDRQQQVEE